MSRKDTVFQAFNTVQNHVYDYVDNHPNLQQTSQSTSRTPPRLIGSTSALPLYGGTGGGESVPNEVLYAAPGQAQRVADQLPASRMARGDARDARRAAAALRSEQLKSGQLKNRHTFASSNGRIILDIFSTPQKTLTYVGGSKERGTGAMKGKVVVHAQEGDRISAIRLKIKAVARVVVPKLGTPQAPFQLDSADPSREPTSEKEILLLQLEQKLYSTPPTALPAGSTSNDPSLLEPGTYEYPFSIDIPSSAGNQGPILPPSFVLASRNTQTQNSAAKGGLFKIPLPSLSSDWASVKWYVKLTVERPGMFRANDRIFAPFVYLPPFPKLEGIEAQLERRQKLAMEVDTALRRFHASNYTGSINFERFTEALSTWNTIPLNYGVGLTKGKRPAPPLANGKSNEEGAGFFSRLMFGSQVEGPASVAKETWSLSIPKKPHVFPLRSGIPFVLQRSIEWRGQAAFKEEELSKVPHVVLLQRVNIYSRPKGPVAGTTVRFITDSRQTPATRPAAISIYDPKGSGKSQLNRRVESWLGIVDMPACTPCFETSILSLDYYLSVRVGVGQSTEVLHSEPVVICCPTPKIPQLVRPKPSSRNHSTNSSPVIRQSIKRIPEKPKVASQKDSSKKQTTSATGSNAIANASPRPGPSNYKAAPATAAASSSRVRPAAQASIPPSIDEKRILHDQQYHHQTISTPTSRSQSPALGSRIPPTPPTRPLETPSHSRAPSEAGTNEDDEEDANFMFNDDEFIDLPPSYFEATNQDD